MHLITSAAPSPFEAMLISLLANADRSTEKADIKAARAATLAAIIMKEAKRRQFVVVNAADIVGMQVNYDLIPSQLEAVGLSRESFIVKCLEEFAPRVAARLALGNVVCMKPEAATFPGTQEKGEVLAMRVNFLAPGYGELVRQDKAEAIAEPVSVSGTSVMGMLA
jgi:hypothetical protein